MRKLKLANKVSQAVLSSIENDLLDILWKKKQAKVKEIYAILKKKRDVAHSSVAVLLDRLHDKNLVTREIETCRGGYRYIYAPTTNKEDFCKEAVQKAVDKLIDVFGSTATTYFNERFGKKR